MINALHAFRSRFLTLSHLSKHICAWLFFAFTSFILQAQSRQAFISYDYLKFETVNTASNRVLYEVRDIMQDGGGFLWFGTKKGLYRFDGVELENHSAYPGCENCITSNGVRALLSAEDGSIWVATDKGVSVYDPKKRAVRSRFIEEVRVQALAQGVDGEIWCGTQNGIYRILSSEAKRFDLSYLPDIAPVDYDINSLVVDRSGNLYAGSNTGKVFTLTAGAGGFQTMYYDELLSYAPYAIYDLSVTHEGTLWLATSKGCFVVNIKSRKVSTFLAGVVCRSVFQTKRGVCWLATEEGIAICDLSKQQVLKHRKGDKLSCLAQDKAGTIWIGTKGGNILKCDPSANRFPAVSLGQTNRAPINAALEAQDGTVWVASDSEGLMHLQVEADSFTIDVKSIKPISGGRLPTDYRATTLHEDAQGNLWAVAPQVGIVKVDSGSHFARLFPFSQLGNLDSNGRIQCLLRVENGDLWIGTGASGLMRFNPKTLRTVSYRYSPNENNSLSDDDVRDIALDQEGKLWVATGKGLCHLDMENSSFTHYQESRHNPQNGPSDDNVLSLFCDSRNDIWIGTHSGGLNKYDRAKNEFICYHKGPQGQSPGSIGTITEDADGALWLGTTDGLAQFDPIDEMFEFYYAEDGLLADHITHVSTSKNGHIYVSTSRGLHAFLSDVLRPNPFLPPVALLSLKTTSRTLRHPEGEVILLSDENAFSVSFAGLNYTDALRNQYRYKLEPLETKWTATSDRKANYTNLNPGEYTFILKAANNDGVWNAKAKRLKIKIGAPIWKTVWFRTAIASLILISAIALYIWLWVRTRAQRLKSTRQLNAQALGEANKKIIEQEAQLDKAYRTLELLSETGQKITSTLSVEKIVETVYSRINSLMDASAFGIGVYDPEYRRLEFSGFMENGRKLPLHYSYLGSENQLSVWCFENRQELFFNRAQTEAKELLGGSPASDAGKAARSLIYLPLGNERELVGVLTVQSFRDDAYDTSHLDTLRSLASFVAVGIKNARSYEEIERQKAVVEMERHTSDALLRNILPKETAEELKKHGVARPRSYQAVTVLFADFKGFTKLTEGYAPEDLIRDLNYCFKAFDKIMERCGLEKIKTIGDAYMAAGGIPVVNETNAEDAVQAALEMQAFMRHWQQKRVSQGLKPWRLRVGIHTGPVIAGVVGSSKYVYDIWGDAVNLAARMEQSGEADRINISGPTYQMVKGHFDCTYRGKIQAKNKGEIDMYFVEDISE